MFLGFHGGDPSKRPGKQGTLNPQKAPGGIPNRFPGKGGGLKQAVLHVQNAQLFIFLGLHGGYPRKGPWSQGTLNQEPGTLEIIAPRQGTLNQPLAKRPHVRRA